VGGKNPATVVLCFCENQIDEMKRTIFFYAIALAFLVFVLKSIEYRFYVRDLSIEFYIGFIAILFTVLGIWAGLKLTRKKTVVLSPDFVLDELKLQKLGISKREHEVLQLMATGLSNQEIADKLFVSLNTIKTHSSNLFLKLEVSRRTQAVQRGKELRLIP
jgi:DNA-binding CsgD family transcriptional regulator